MQISDIEYSAPLGKSDHSVISFKYPCYLDFSKPKVIFNYEKGDFYGMRNNLIASKWAGEIFITWKLYVSGRTMIRSQNENHRT